MKSKNWALLILLLLPLVGCHQPSKLEKDLKADIKEWKEVTSEMYIQIAIRSRDDDIYDQPRGYKVDSGIHQYYCIMYGGRTEVTFMPLAVSFTISYKNPEVFHNVNFQDNGDIAITEYYNFTPKLITETKQKEEIIGRLKKRLPKDYLP